MKCFLFCVLLGALWPLQAVAISSTTTTSLPAARMSSTAMVSPTGLAPQVNQRPALPSRRQKRLTRRLHRNGDSPAGKFFLSLGIAAVLGVLAAVFAEIAILSLVLLIAGGVFLFVALWFLIRWLYYYW